ncbi:MAG: hypothetical protein KatS3mg053_1204 [Candidatus Roseilinea sp.]|nr:MAG: hypothetical protein KatS3mg053_1204 [Candidatus Roseilinea sp.]
MAGDQRIVEAIVAHRHGLHAQPQPARNLTRNVGIEPLPAVRPIERKRSHTGINAYAQYASLTHRPPAPLGFYNRAQREKGDDDHRQRHKKRRHNALQGLQRTTTTVPRGAHSYNQAALPVGMLTQPWLIGRPKLLCQYVPCIA